MNLDKELEGYEYMCEKRKEFKYHHEFITHMLKCPKCGNKHHNRPMGGQVECGRYGHRYPFPDGWGMWMSKHHDSFGHQMREGVGGVMSGFGKLLKFIGK